MPAWLIVVLCVFPGLPLLGLVVRTVLRAVRLRDPRPMPHWFAPVIDNPWRRLIFPPKKYAARLGVEPGMRVLEVGPGNGSYTLAAARRIGEGGKLIAVDIQPEIIERLQARAGREGVANLEARPADVYDLPFADGAFDLVYLIFVIGEIPEPERVLREFRRVLVPGGGLSFGEVFPDPDYTRPDELEALVGGAGFELIERRGHFLGYTARFRKPA